MNKEIGSTFYLDQKDILSLPKKSIKCPKILNIGESYVSTCRSAIGLCLDTLVGVKKVALLPSFTCESVLGPFLKRGYEVYPYPIGKDLLIHWSDFKKVVEEIQPSVILTHPYFGFGTIHELRGKITELRIEKNIIFIEDMTQSMFSKITPLPSNFHVGSIRKWMPIPDGAFTTAPNNSHKEDVELQTAKLKAFSEKGEYILYGKGDKSVFRKDFGVAESILDSREDVFSMSSVSRELYAEANIEEMKTLRFQNYLFLENGIERRPELNQHLSIILPLNKKGICPFHFPVLVKEGREELQQYLASKDIYATVIWGCPKEFEDKINGDARYVYDHILCFHVDQRYDMNDMKRIIDTLCIYYS